MDGKIKPFSLDAVLSYRKRLEELAQQRLFQARNERAAVAARMAREEDALSLLIEETERLQQEGIRITDLIFRQERIRQQSENLTAIRKKLEEKKEVEKQMREDLALRSRERQVMEKLKKQQNQNWHAYLDKKEAQMLDEIAVIRHASKTRETPE